MDVEEAFAQLSREVMHHSFQLPALMVWNGILTLLALALIVRRR